MLLGAPADNCRGGLAEAPLEPLCRIARGKLLCRDLYDGLPEAAAVEHSHECTNGLIESVGDIFSLADCAVFQSPHDLLFEVSMELRVTRYDEAADGETFR